ncbi:hypothetical protein KIH87_12660 [Paraneptunicella aestuarii]|uniref:hypothetical protein n=1 Tax=Paraneptunicella aestuarii TaxID=2831148 RepID=UPI001E2F789C|nr:hypothetical protein [Paraneptunicella aestuarii]UAA37560.1 hypothetical protein KIH87_12660 [Paraneptunicella aestuarii]
MKHLIITSIAYVALVTGKYASAEIENSDTSTIPILFYADQNSYQALSPWYSFLYQDQQIKLQTCPEQACIQSLQFTDIENTEPFSGSDYQPSYQGQPGNIKQLETYSQLNLGSASNNALHASGNQRRILFTLQVSSQPATLAFEFNDSYEALFSEDQLSLTRTHEACATLCETTWQAFNVDRDGRYTPARFITTESGGWRIESSKDSTRIELTTLIGEYQQPSKHYHSDQTTQSSYKLDEDSMVISYHQGQLQRHHLIGNEVMGLGENTWLLKQKGLNQKEPEQEEILLTDHNAEILAKRPMSELKLPKFFDSHLDKGRVYLLGLAPVDAKDIPSQQTIMTQYPAKHSNTMVTTQLLELDGNLSLVSATTIYLPDTELAQVKITPEPWGILVGTGEISVSSISHTYQTNQSSSAMSSGCPMMNDGYGYGLLCWKALNNPTLTYTPSNASGMIPTFVVDNTTPALINNLENNQHGVIFKNGSTPVDPNGTWTHPNNAASSKENLALAIAMYHHRWSSPVAANIVYPAGSTPHPVMFRKVEYEAANTDNLPHKICSNFAASSGYAEYQAANACMGQLNFGLFTLKTLTFDRWQGSTYLPNNTINGSDNTWFPWFTNYVGDPPETDPFQQAASNEMIARIKFHAGEFGRINQDTYINGQLFSQGSVNGYYLCDH